MIITKEFRDETVTKQKRQTNKIKQTFRIILFIFWIQAREFSPLISKINKKKMQITQTNKTIINEGLNELRWGMEGEQIDYKCKKKKQSMDLGVQSTRTNKTRNYVREMNRNQWIITTRNTFK